MSYMEIPRLDLISDNLKFYFGSSEDFWLMYDETTDNALELWSNDIDGAGTNGQLMSIPSSSNYVDFPTSLYLHSGFASRGGVTDPSWSYEDDTNTGLYSSGEDILDIAASGVQMVSVDGGNDWVDIAGRVYNSSEPLNLGALASTSHSLTAGDVVAGGKLEVKDNVYFEGDVTLASTKKLSLGGGILCCITQTFTYDEFTDGGGASGTLVLDESIPDGAVVLQSVLHTLTGFTGDTSAFIQVGDGTDVDRYSTGTPSVYTTNPSGTDLRTPSGTRWHDAEKNVTITITSNSNFTNVSAGQATINIYYFSF